MLVARDRAVPIAVKQIEPFAHLLRCRLGANVSGDGVEELVKLPPRDQAAHCELEWLHVPEALWMALRTRADKLSSLSLSASAKCMACRRIRMVASCSAGLRSFIEGVASFLVARRGAMRASHLHLFNKK